MKEERDDAISRTLAAIGRTQLPQGLETRVLEGLERHEAAAQLRAERVAGMAGAWWRGVLSGAAVATVLAVATPAIVQHWTRVETGNRPVATRVDSDSARSSTGLAAAASEQKPCASTTAVGMRRIVVERGGETVRIDGKAGSRPAPELGLTAQERELVRAARTAGLKDLSALNPEARAKADADDVAQFENFFYQPPIKVATEPNNE